MSLALKPLDLKLPSFVEEKASCHVQKPPLPTPPIHKWTSKSKFKYQARWLHNILHLKNENKIALQWVQYDLILV